MINSFLMFSFDLRLKVHCSTPLTTLDRYVYREIHRRSGLKEAQDVVAEGKEGALKEAPRPASADRTIAPE